MAGLFFLPVGTCGKFCFGVVLGWIIKQVVRAVGSRLYMLFSDDIFLAAKAKSYQDYMDEMDLVWSSELDTLNKLSDGWGIEQTGGMVCVLSFYMPDHDDFEDGHYLMVSSEEVFSVDRAECLASNWLVGHYGGLTGNTSECGTVATFEDSVKWVADIFDKLGVK